MSPRHGITRSQWFHHTIFEPRKLCHRHPPFAASSNHAPTSINQEAGLLQAAEKNDPRNYSASLEEVLEKDDLFKNVD
jgi:hypothetical protein